MKRYRSMTLTDYNLQIEAYLAKLRLTNSALNTQIPATLDNVEYFWRIFKCTRCGKCCTELSDINVPNYYVKILADYFRMTKKRFKKTYLKKVSGKYYLPHPCPFYKDTGCSIYKFRPPICEVYPIIRLDNTIYISIKCKAMEGLCHQVLERRFNSLAQS